MNFLLRNHLCYPFRLCRFWPTNSFFESISLFLTASVKDDDSPVDSPIKATRSIYLCGNSLGLQPKMTEALVLEELEVWRKEGVYGHHTHPKGRPWININETVIDGMATLVGALPSEVAVMGTLTSNLHTLMATFYRPNPTRYKIIIEAKAFPSDQVCCLVRRSSHT